MYSIKYGSEQVYEKATWVNKNNNNNDITTDMIADSAGDCTVPVPTR